MEKSNEELVGRLDDIIKRHVITCQSAISALARMVENATSDLERKTIEDALESISSTAQTAWDKLYEY